MQVEYCKSDHANSILYYISSINTAICEDCHNKFLREGYECTSINSMANAYLCDAKALKNKWAMVYDNACSNQAKYTLAFEKLLESITSTFESYIAEVIRTKESIIKEAIDSKTKFLDHLEKEIFESKGRIKSSVEQLEIHIASLDKLIGSSNLNELLSLIGSVDIPNKSQEIDNIKDFLDKAILQKTPELPFIINKKPFSQDEILSQVDIKRGTYEVSIDNQPIEENHFQEIVSKELPSAESPKEIAPIFQV